MMWGHYDGFSWWWFVIMPVGMLGFWAVVAWVIVTLVRGERPSERAPASEAERILAERYARGEIDASEYHARLADLQATTGPVGGRSP
ncbi:MAG TPA: SHOCT domain-containing protein [Acidimicrobiales bacterium]|nr:SHOCT domain-containing protein [Acidimicrobiales bacterium]